MEFIGVRDRSISAWRDRSKLGCQGRAQGCKGQVKKGREPAPEQRTWGQTRDFRGEERSQRKLATEN